MKLRPAFTMIELVFIIVILGILAAIAIPKVSANRLDAKIIAIKQDIGTFTQALLAMAMSQGDFYKSDSDDIPLGFNDIASAISRENWKEFMHDEHAGRKHATGICTTLSTKGQHTNECSKSCVEMWLKRTVTSPGKPIDLVVEIKESPICQRIGPAGEIEYPLIGKDVKF